jgi:hypothetical protein
MNFFFFFWFPSKNDILIEKQIGQGELNPSLSVRLGKNREQKR